MTDELDRTIAEIREVADPPQESDDLVFQAPWQARAFGLVVTLHQQGLFEWNEFQSRLIEQIEAEAFADGEADPETVYYRQWIAALERLLEDEALFDDETLEERSLEFARGERDASEFVVSDAGGHDHRYDRDH